MVTWLGSLLAQTLKPRKKAQLCFWGTEANSSSSPICPACHPALLCRVPASQADGRGGCKGLPKPKTIRLSHKSEQTGRGVEGELRGRECSTFTTGRLQAAS